MVVFNDVASHPRAVHVTSLCFYNSHNRNNCTHQLTHLSRHAGALASRCALKVQRGGHLEDALAVVDANEEVAEDQREDGHELHHNVKSRAGGVLQGITHSVANHSRLVKVSLLTLNNLHLVADLVL